MTFNPHDHDVDTNPDWKPRFGSRVYKCSGCGHEIVTTTNHTGSCYPMCEGSCRQIINPHTAREVVLRKQTKHVYVKEYERS